MRSTPAVYAPGPVGPEAAAGVRRCRAVASRGGDTVLPRAGVAVLLKVVMIAGVALVALPALWLGIRGARRRSGYSSVDPGDRASIVVLVVLRVLILLLMLVLSAVVLISAIGALIKDVVMPDLVLIFFVLDLLLAMLVLLTFGRRDPRPARRRASPARR